MHRFKILLSRHFSLGQSVSFACLVPQETGRNFMAILYLHRSSIRVSANVREYVWVRESLISRRGRHQARSSEAASSPDTSTEYPVQPYLLTSVGTTTFRDLWAQGTSCPRTVLLGADSLSNVWRRVTSLNATLQITSAIASLQCPTNNSDRSRKKAIPGDWG